MSRSTGSGTISFGLVSAPFRLHATTRPVRRGRAPEAGPDLLEIEAFVPASSIDPVVVRKAHFVSPDLGGDRALHLLAQAMTRAELVAVGRFTMRGRSRVAVLRPYKAGLLLLQQCFDADELRPLEGIYVGSVDDFKPIEHDLADRLVARLRKPDALDMWAAPSTPTESNVIDLLAWLRASVRKRRAALAASEDV